MPATTVRRTNRVSALITKLKPNSPKKRFVAFVLIFMAIGGGYFMYRSFAAVPPTVIYTLDGNTRDYADQVYAVPSTGGTATQVTHTLARNGFVKWSPDHTKMVMTANPGGANVIVVQNADGTNRKQVTTPPASVNGSGDFYPYWSPDSKKIVFARVQTTGTTVTLTTVNADGTGLTPLVNIPTTVCGSTTCFAPIPVWSPDGAHIAFQTNANGGVSIVNPDGTGKKDLVTTAGSQPITWSPKGTQIVYGTNGASGQDLNLMYTDGTNQHVLVKGAYWVSPGAKIYSPDGYSVLFIDYATGKKLQKVSPFNNAVSAVYTLPTGGTDNGSRFFSAAYPAGDSSNVLALQITDNAANNYQQKYELVTYNTNGTKQATLASYLAGGPVGGTYYSIPSYDW